MAGSKRGSRVQRPASPPNVQLTARDLDLLDDLGRVRVLTAALAEQLHFPPQAGRRAQGFSSSCRARLRRLWQAGYLARHWPDRFQGPPVYALDRRGVQALAAYRGRAAGDLATLGPMPGSLFLAHALGIAQVYAAVAPALAGVAEVYLAAFWGEHRFKGRGGYDRLPDPADGRQRIPVLPDGLFWLARADGRRRLVFLEVDEGTMTLARVAVKVRGYEAYRQGEGPARFQARFGCPPEFSVAFVAPTLDRRQRLQQTVADQLHARGWAARAGRYLFHCLPDLTPATALVWADAQAAPVALLGPAPAGAG